MAVVKKKPLNASVVSDSIDLTSKLELVRSTISTLPGETEMTEGTAATASTEGKPAIKKKPAAPAKKKPAAAAAKKKPAPAVADNMVTLAEICKSAKIDPRLGRRRLRNAGVTVDGSRWAWKKGSSELKKAETAVADPK